MNTTFQILFITPYHNCIINPAENKTKISTNERHKTMKEPTKNIRIFLTCIALVLFIFGINNNVFAQEVLGSSVDFESSPYVEITEQETSASHTEERTDAWSFGAFPIIFYSDETRLAGGAGVQAVHKTESEQHSSTIGLIAFISTLC